MRWVTPAQAQQWLLAPLTAAETPLPPRLAGVAAAVPWANATGGANAAQLLRNLRRQVSTTLFLMHC
jgi:hypothetical protein